MQEIGFWIPINDKINLYPKHWTMPPWRTMKRVQIPQALKVESSIILLSLSVAALVERAVINYKKVTNGQGCAEDSGPGTWHCNAAREKLVKSRLC